jgi:predicted RND superfamily exporter protein
VATDTSNVKGGSLVADKAKREAIVRGLILLAVLVSFVLSVSLWFSGRELEGIFVGIWVPSILSLGAFLLPRGRAL